MSSEDSVRTEAQPSVKCCNFGKLFDESYDAEFMQLSIHQALRYFKPLAFERFPGFNQGTIEKHRRCLGVNPRGGHRLDGKERTLPVGQREPENHKRESLKIERFAHIMADIEPPTGPAEMTPEREEFEKRVGIIVALIKHGEWRDYKTVLTLEKQWKITAADVEAIMAEAANRLERSRGGPKFETQVSIEKITALRDLAEGKGDLKSAISAQAHRDKITKVIAPVPAAAVQINNNAGPRDITKDPEFIRSVNVIASAIGDVLDVPQYRHLYKKVVDKIERAVQRLSQGLGPELIELDAEEE